MDSKRMKPRLLRTALGLLGVALVDVAAAQSRAPDAGSLLRETDSAQRPIAPNAVPSRSQPAPVTSGTTVRVAIKAVRIDGAVRYSEAQLQALVADLVGREADYLELRRAADKITQKYRADGWFARAYLPEQSLEDGILTIAVIEARVGEVRIEEPANGANVRQDRVHDMLLSRQHEGDPLAIAALERATLLVDELPGIAAAVVLAPGDDAGETDIVARIEDTARLTGNLEGDNSGIESTGRERLISRFALASPLRWGDELSVLTNLSTGDRFGRLAYDAPVGADGWRIGAAVSALEYELGGEFEPLNAHGRAATWSLNAAYPLVRGNKLNARFTSAYEERHYRNFALDMETSESSVRAVRGGVQADRLDGIGGGGLMIYGVQMTSGRVDLASNPQDLALDAMTARSDGDYFKLTWNIGRLQRIGVRDRLSLSFFGQEASRNLDSSERLSLGGAGGVRAYPELEASGDEGWIANVEWTRTLPRDWSVSLFYDTGVITQHKRLWTSWNAGNPTLRNRYTLDGAGASIGWSGFPGLQVRASAATRFGANPGANPDDGQDADGSRREPQLWISARWQL